MCIERKLAMKQLLDRTFVHKKLKESLEILLSNLMYDDTTLRDKGASGKCTT